MRFALFDVFALVGRRDAAHVLQREEDGVATESRTDDEEVTDDLRRTEPGVLLRLDDEKLSSCKESAHTSMITRRHGGAHKRLSRRHPGHVQVDLFTVSR
jgi:hypothetical protein